jgi:hypothetical protein
MAMRRPGAPRASSSHVPSIVTVSTPRQQSSSTRTRTRSTASIYDPSIDALALGLRRLAGITET